MLFNSLEFIYGFLPLCLLFFYLPIRFKLLHASQFLLLLMSLAFYGYWKISYLILILFKIITNYALAIWLDKKPSRFALGFGIVFNLGILCYFKYFNFFVDTLNHLVSLPDIHVRAALPLGISFYTFTQIAYLLDLYQKKTRFYGLIPYSLFVVFFPHLIAGPIVHYFQMMPQFNRKRTFLVQYRNVFHGVFFFIIGLFQKVVIADSVMGLADLGFRNAHLLSVIEAWSALIAYSMQIYFDFAGYSNMAIGLALLFNIRFPINFNSPYKAESIIDFWRRWHITLSHFLRDYLYIPLGGNRRGPFRTYANIFLTMLIGGFWHGAGWTFILWGAYHGILIVGNHMLEKTNFRIPKAAARIATFILVCYGWVFFRSETMAQAGDMTAALFGFHGFTTQDTYFLWKSQVVLVLLAFAIALFAPNAEWWAKKTKPNFVWGLIMALLFTSNLLCLNRESAFLYFQF